MKTQIIDYSFYNKITTAQLSEGNVLLIGAPTGNEKHFRSPSPLGSKSPAFVWFPKTGMTYPYIKPENPNEKEVFFRTFPHGKIQDDNKYEIISSSGLESKLICNREDEFTVFQGGYYNGKFVNFYLRTEDKKFIIDDGSIVDPSNVLYCELSDVLSFSVYRVLLRPITEYKYFSA